MRARENTRRSQASATLEDSGRESKREARKAKASGIQPEFNTICSESEANASLSRREGFYIYYICITSHVVSVEAVVRISLVEKIYGMYIFTFNSHLKVPHVSGQNSILTRELITNDDTALPVLPPAVIAVSRRQIFSRCSFERHGQVPDHLLRSH